MTGKSYRRLILFAPAALLVTLLLFGCGGKSRTPSLVGVWQGEIGAPDVWIMTLKSDHTGGVHLGHTDFSTGIPKPSVEDHVLTWEESDGSLIITSEGSKQSLRILAKSETQIILEMDQKSVTFKRAD